MSAEESSVAVDARVVVDVWADVMCPFCYLGHTHLDRALADFDHRDAVEVRYHSFELVPGLVPGEVQRLDESMMAMNKGLPERGAEVGLEYRFEDMLLTGTRTAHELIHYARTQGLAHDMLHRLFRALLTEGRNVGELETLADLAAEVGLDRADALATLRAGAFETAVSDDIAQAQRLGVRGVPFFVFNNTTALSGAQPIDTLQQALQTAWTDADPEPAVAEEQSQL